MVCSLEGVRTLANVCSLYHLRTLECDWKRGYRLIYIYLQFIYIYTYITYIVVLSLRKTPCTASCFSYIKPSSKQGVCLPVTKSFDTYVYIYMSYSATEFQWQDLLPVHWTPNNQVSCLITAMILLKSRKALFCRCGAGKLVQQGACGHTSVGVDISKMMKKTSWAQRWPPCHFMKLPFAMCQKDTSCLFLLRSIGLCTEPGCFSRKQRT